MGKLYILKPDNSPRKEYKTAKQRIENLQITCFFLVLAVIVETTIILALWSK